MRTTTARLPLILALAALLLVPFAAAADDRDEPVSFRLATRKLADVGREVLSGLDNNLLVAVYSEQTGPARFAEPVETFLTPTNSGTWDDLADGSRLWRLVVVSPGARNVNLALRRFDVPEGARLWLYEPDRELVQGPYTRADRTEDGELWTALVLGEEVVVELHLPAGSGEADLVVDRVHHGFRGFGPPGVAKKQGACQNDVVCKVADPYRQQVRAVAWYSVGGVGACTGTLMNNAARDGKPYFLSAEHCEITKGNAGTLVIYWKYESPTCGRLNGGSLQHNQTGATFRASYRPSDFVLVELKKKPEPRFNVYYAGWNAVNQAPKRAVGIHHPNLDEKSISFNNRPLTADGRTHWEIVWNDGTTEPGSSGSCIFDAAGQCVGTLTGGSSYCWDPQAPDYYGRMSVHWTGGGGKGNSLKPWLDPTNSGRKTLAGLEPSNAGGGGGGTGGGGGGGGGGSACTPNATTTCLVGGRFKVTADWTDSNGKKADARLAERSDKSGAFYFGNAAHWEMHVRVEDGCGAQGFYGVFAAASTDRAFTLRVEDTSTAKVRTYRNSAGKVARAVLDDDAFACQ